MSLVITASPDLIMYSTREETYTLPGSFSIVLSSALFTIPVSAPKSRVDSVMVIGLPESISSCIDFM